MSNEIEVVNAFVSNGRLVILKRDAAGKLEWNYARAEYAAFIQADQFQRVERALRASSGVKSARIEGDYVRIVFTDYGSRDQLVNGSSNKPVGFFATHDIPTFEADLNPVRIHARGQGASVLDALFVVA